MAGLIAGLLVLSAVPAQAMGTGNPYADAQDGLNYVVYQPAYTAGLSLTHFGMHTCAAGQDQALNVNYLSGKKSILLTESASTNICVENFMLIRGATRTVVNKPGAGTLLATQVVVISVGIERAQLNVFFSLLVPRATAPGSTNVPPVLIDPTIVKYAGISLNNIISFTVPDPDKWTATIANPKIVSFIPGKVREFYISNPGLKPLMKGKTIVTLHHNGKNIVFTVTVIN
ncbi:MAG TPA: hypothetical protein VIH79_05095 [Candidatus Nanopelagicaceae bacterium]